MRTFLVAAISLATTAHAGEIPTYAEAISRAEHLTASAELREWGEAVLQPYLNRAVPEISTCAGLLPDPGQATIKLVIDFAKSPAHIHDEASTPVSACVRSRLEALSWTSSPPGIRYFPLELKLTLDSKADQAAEDFIISITPTDKSKGQTRERKGD